MYDVLGRRPIETSATDRDIKVAYRDIAALIHPDKCSEENATEAFKKVNEANEVLSDAARRSIYDAEQARAPRRRRPSRPRRRRRGAARSRSARRRSKRSKKQGAQAKGAGGEARKAASDDDDDDFIADSDEEEEESEAEESESDDEEEEDDAPESEDDDDVVGGSDDDDDERLQEERRRGQPGRLHRRAAEVQVRGPRPEGLGTKGVLISRLEDAARGSTTGRNRAGPPRRRDAGLRRLAAALRLLVVLGVVHSSISVSVVVVALPFSISAVATTELTELPRAQAAPARSGSRPDELPRLEPRLPLHERYSRADELQGVQPRVPLPERRRRTAR